MSRLLVCVDDTFTVHKCVTCHRCFTLTNTERLVRGLEPGNGSVAHTSQDRPEDTARNLSPDMDLKTRKYEPKEKPCVSPTLPSIPGSKNWACYAENSIGKYFQEFCRLSGSSFAFQRKCDRAKVWVQRGVWFQGLKRALEEDQAYKARGSRVGTAGGLRSEVDAGGVKLGQCCREWKLMMVGRRSVRKCRWEDWGCGSFGGECRKSFREASKSTHHSRQNIQNLFLGCNIKEKLQEHYGEELSITYRQVFFPQRGTIVAGSMAAVLDISRFPFLLGHAKLTPLFGCIHTPFWVWMSIHTPLLIPIRRGNNTCRGLLKPTCGGKGPPLWFHTYFSFFLLITSMYIHKYAS
ncbi:hypothetical protein VP01_1906g2 [Puccinia sorghi]|uniref:Uncharacterized protein n=1 Tax=Puccinia sorghi TaxID=27349 RepID=A0A0L6VCP3_9BASI|nr:hypothetical protein VP01_1906g2 [Puccinia sorghi]